MQEELIGRNISERVSPEDRERTLEAAAEPTTSAAEDSWSGWMARESGASANTDDTSLQTESI